jgi:hypothetical protein
MTMTTAERTVSDAIDRSGSHTEIVTLDYDADVLAALESMITDGAVDGNDAYEFWGTRDDGRAWRVHVRRRSEVA